MGVQCYSSHGSDQCASFISSRCWEIVELVTRFSVCSLLYNLQKMPTEFNTLPLRYIRSRSAIRSKRSYTYRNRIKSNWLSLILVSVFLESSSHVFSQMIDPRLTLKSRSDDTITVTIRHDFQGAIDLLLINS